MNKSIWRGRSAVVGVFSALAGLGACATEEPTVDELGDVEEAVTSACSVSITSVETAVTYGQPIHVNAIATCPSGTPVVQFYRKVNTGNYAVVQAFGTSTNLTYTTAEVGTDTFYAAVKQQGSMDSPALSNVISVPIADTVASCTAVVLSAPVGGASFQAGTAVTLSGAATCPSGTTPEYQYWVKQSTTQTWTVLSGYFPGSTTFAFSPASDWNVKVVARSQGAHVTYQAASNSTTIHITPGAMNHAPVANPDSISTPHLMAITYNVTANDTDADGDTLTITGVGAASNGLTSFTSPNVTYSPNLGSAGSDSFTYDISDGHGGSATGTVTVTVTDNAPTTADDTASTFENQAVSVNVLSNDNDVDSDTLTVVSVGSAASGTITHDATSVTYTPNAGFVGPDTFLYTISDGYGGTANGNVTINVQDHAPVANDDSASTNENTAISISVASNDTDADGDTLTVQSVTLGANGGTVIDGGGQSVTYTPNHGFAGTDSFSYTINDGHGLTATANVVVTVVDQAPTANADTETTPSNTAVTFDPTTNDTDVNGDTLSVQSVTTPGHGSASFSGNNVTYTPNSNFVGGDSFTYVVSDGHLTATGSISVSVTDQGPFAISDSATTTENTAVVINVLSNDSDPDGGTLSVASVTTPSNGTATTNGTTVTYTPNASFVGPDSFTYTIIDGQGGTATGGVSVTVTTPTPGCTISISAPETSVVYGDPVHLTATASCNTGAAQVQWFKKIGTGSNYVLIPWTLTPTLTYPTQDVGDNQFSAQARTVGTIAPQATSNVLHVQVADTVASCTSVVVTSPGAGTSWAINTPVTLTALATCPAGTTPEYEFWVKPSSSQTWQVLPGYTTGSSSFSFPTSGTWNVTAVARSVGAHVAYQVRANSVNITTH